MAHYLGSVKRILVTQIKGHDNKIMRAYLAEETNILEDDQWVHCTWPCSHDISDFSMASGLPSGTSSRDESVSETRPCRPERW